MFAIEFAAYSSPQLPVAFTRAPADPGAVVPLRETGERRALYAASDGWRTYSAFTRLAPTWAGDIRGALAVYWRVEAASGYSAFLDPAYATAISYDPVGEPARLGGMRRRALQDRNRVLDVLSVRYVLLPNNSVTDRLLTRTRTRGWLCSSTSWCFPACAS